MLRKSVDEKPSAAASLITNSNDNSNNASNNGSTSTGDMEKRTTKILFQKCHHGSSRSFDYDDCLEYGDLVGQPNEETPLKKWRQDYRREYCKTIFAAVCVFVATLTGSFVVAYVNRFSVPQNASLPDFVFELIPQQDWAWEIADVTVIVCPLFTFLVLIFHKHYTIVFRRLCINAAALYLIRAVFLLCTYLPPPFKDFKTRCLKANFSDDATQFFATTFALVFKVGFSSDENQIMCGDTIYSGHSMIFTLMCLHLRYYTPRPWRQYPLLLTIFMSFIGIVCVLISRQHYTIDVVVAIFVTCAFFYAYRSWTLYKCRETRCFSWRQERRRFRPLVYLFLIFEHNVPPGPIPNDLAWPFPYPKIFVRLFEQWNAGSSGDWAVNSRFGPREDSGRPVLDV